MNINHVECIFIFSLPHAKREAAPKLTKMEVNLSHMKALMRKV